MDSVYDILQTVDKHKLTVDVHIVSRALPKENPN